LHAVGRAEADFDLFGYGTREDGRVAVVGECKVRVKARDVRKFVDRVRHAAETLGAPALPFLFAFFVETSAKNAARELGVALLTSR
jgi:hypothetical protein